VYRAWDTGSGRVVALKVLHPHLASDLGVLERFRREAQLAAAVVHRNITTIYEVGQHGNRHFIAMEYLPDSIHNLIVSAGRLPIDRAVDICRQAAVGLEAASRRGIIHRDIKPQNLLLAPDGTVKVTDFGIARATALSTMTRTGALTGTPHYMSPEQAQGHRVDIRSDIYSLGIVLYQMLTGQLPFEANTPYEVIRQQVEQRPGPVRRLRSNIPGAVERIVNRCLEKNPERRYQSPGDLARALGEAVPGTGRERIRQQQRAPAAPGSPPRQPAQPAQRRAERARPNTTWMQSWARAWQKTHRSRWAWMLPVIPILIALVVAAVRLDVVDVDSAANWVGAGGQPVVQNTPAPLVSTPDNGITIPDRNLRTAIAATLNIAAGEPITAADMAKLTEFDAPDSFISDLSGLEAAINLKELNLRGNAIADLSPLASLVNLRHLDFSDNTIADVSPLGGSPNIAYLYIAGNLISDVAPLAGLTQLRHLHISDNSISDVSPLAALPNLEELSLHINSISDLSPLVANTGLGAGDQVNVERNPLSDQSVNQHIPALRVRGVDVVRGATRRPGTPATPEDPTDPPPEEPIPQPETTPALTPALANGDFRYGFESWTTETFLGCGSHSEVRILDQDGPNSNVAQFIAQGNGGCYTDSKLLQMLDIEVSSISQVIVSADVKSGHSAVRGPCGDSGAEMPLLMQLEYVADQGQNRAIVWSFTHKTGGTCGIRDGWLDGRYPSDFDDEYRINTTVPHNEWHSFTSEDVKAIDPAMVRLTRVLIMGSGWDRDGRIDNIQISTIRPDKSTIVFGELNWESAQTQNRIVQYIVEHGYGYPTELEPGAGVPLIHDVRNGRVDVLMEIWLPNQAEMWADAIEAQEIVDLGTSLGSDWQSSFVIPRYLQEQYPELDHVNDLRSPRYQRLFATASSGGKAELVGCVIGWSCWDINRQQVQAYDLDNYVQVTEPGATEGLYSSIRNAYEKREPWLGYMWGSADPALELDLVRLEEPPYNERCWDAQRSCGFPDSTIFMAGSLNLADSAPEVADFLKRWSFDFTQWSSIRSWRKANPDSSIEDAAIFWLVQYHSVWTE
jgi:ABC-type proline/glycine betaine transport system substrate-binding protein